MMKNVSLYWVGEIVQHVEYVPFGEVFIEERNNVWNTPYLFNAKELDEETELYYYGARYYDPRISVWLSVDSIATKVLDTSPYIYVANNPIRFTDPDGKIKRDTKGNIIVSLTDNKVYTEEFATDYPKYGKIQYQYQNVNIFLNDDTPVLVQMVTGVLLDGKELTNREAVYRGFEPTSNCMGYALTDGSLFLGAEQAIAILNDTYTPVSSPNDNAVVVATGNGQGENMYISHMSKVVLDIEKGIIYPQKDAVYFPTVGKNIEDVKKHGGGFEDGLDVQYYKRKEDDKIVEVSEGDTNTVHGVRIINSNSNPEEN
jgi:RHS repeat-associated protein